MITLSPRQKLATAAASALVLALALVVSNGSAATGARVLMGGLALGGLVLWVRGAQAPRRFANVPRLQVVQKIGLSARAGVALVEVDGRSFLIVHGDGGTRIRRVSSRAAVMAQAVKEDPS